jgi:hypothetical protein
MLLETDFVVGRDNFADLIINPTSFDSFYFFFNKRDNRLVKRFVLDNTHPKVTYGCEVTLIKKNDKFTPRLHFTVKDETGKLKRVRAEANEETIHLKASVSLKDCYVQFWELISYLGSLSEIEIPRESFSLVSKAEGEIVAAIRRRNTESIKSIIKQLAEEVSLSTREVNDLLQRKKRLSDFQHGLSEKRDEDWWQNFFEENTWIFGYGLNYVVLRLEQSQVHVGGMDLAGKGEKIPDFLTTTGGNVSFTVLIEIKTAETRLLAGTKAIRSGAWSLNKDLTDAVAQIQASVEEWAHYGSKHPTNKEKLEKKNIHTVKPKGIIVVGCLDEVKENLAKRSTFELFRQSVHGIEIITFDELYDRARFIVDHTT